jgi:hypothetical protein
VKAVVLADDLGKRISIDGEDSLRYFSDQLAMRYLLDPDGIHRSSTPIRQRDNECDKSGFDLLLQMRAKHFWYRGRHRFLLAALDWFLGDGGSSNASVDLGGRRQMGALPRRIVGR